MDQGGKRDARPSQYHVVFFDAKEKVITRARMSDKRLVFIDKKKMGRNERLACEMARQQEERIVRRGGEISVWESDLRVLGDLFGQVGGERKMMPGTTAVMRVTGIRGGKGMLGPVSTTLCSSTPRRRSSPGPGCLTRGWCS